jgi:hypothetical protein
VKRFSRSRMLLLTERKQKRIDPPLGPLQGSRAQSYCEGLDSALTNLAGAVSKVFLSFSEQKK